MYVVGIYVTHGAVDKGNWGGAFMSSPIMKDEKITLADFIVDYADAITAIISKVVKKDTHFQISYLVLISITT